jgi:hypothetical protein
MVSAKNCVVFFQILRLFSCFHQVSSNEAKTKTLFPNKETSLTKEKENKK